MNEKTVCVVMSTYNGEKYLREQLDSILEQADVKVRIFVRDDGSTDSTIDILESYKKDGLISYYKGENKGPKYSFLEALLNSPKCDYYAFADQDDVWESSKLNVALGKLVETENSLKPSLYCGSTKLVDANLKPLSIKNGFMEPHEFLCGERRSVAGCTMVFNNALKQLICQYEPKVFPMHDAWIQNVSMAIDSYIVYDSIPYILYRQHGNNAVGGRKGILASVKRRINYLKKQGKNFQTKMYLEILQNYKGYMPKDKIERCFRICSYKESIKNKFKVFSDKKFWAGRFHWKIETMILILFNWF